MHLITSIEYDITACLIICSNHGACKLINEKYECTCNDEFYGSSCDKNKKVCQTEKKCLNSGTCIDIIQSYNTSNTVEYTYKCLCDEYYYGLNCENKINVCQNETCSSNGYCKDLNNKPVCVCFKMFNGSKCEFKSSEKVLLENVSKISTIITILVFVLLAFLIVILDISKCFNQQESKKFFRPKKQKIYAMKFVYKNWFFRF